MSDSQIKLVRRSHPTVAACVVTWEMVALKFPTFGDKDTLEVRSTTFYGIAESQANSILTRQSVEKGLWMLGPYPDGGFWFVQDLSEYELAQVSDDRPVITNGGTAHYVCEVSVVDPDTNGAVELSIYKDRRSSGLFGVDCSFLETLSDDDPVREPFNGNNVLLIDGPYGASTEKLIGTTLEQEIQNGKFENDCLDELVHDAATQLASNVNCDGIRFQIEFLIRQCGWTEQDINLWLKHNQ